MLKIDNVSKQYKLGQIGGTTLYWELQRLSAKLHGREDPTKKIGAKDYNKGETFMALDGVSFDVKKGERVGIIGHNGAGKSTLLKLISRVTAPTGGSIWLNGRVASMLEVGTGFHPELTGRENIYMNGAILGMTKKEIDAKMEDIIEFSECRQFIDTPVKRYSSGMYVKLAFSVAAHLDSEIMIMDEVLAVGDMAFQKKCLDKMKDVSEQYDRTILYVSHNMKTIRQLCDRVVVLEKGKKIFDGEVEKGIDVYSNLMPLSNDGYYALSDQSMHYAQDFNKPIVMEWLRFLGDSSMFRFNQPIAFEIGMNVSERIDNLGLRISISKSDGVKIGTSNLDRPFSVPSIGQNKACFSFDPKGLTPGRYRFNIVLYSRDEHGRNRNLDCVITYVQFEIAKDYENDTLFNWDSRYQGDIIFEDMKYVETGKN